MHQKVVVVEPLSQSNLNSERPCWQCLKDNGALPFCSHCQIIQPPLSQVTDFELLSVAPQFLIDEVELKSKYISRVAEVHPDRFSKKTPRELIYSTQWATRLNLAWKNIGNLEARAIYILGIKGITVDPKSASISLELAEEYFDLQDMSYDVQENQLHWQAFQKRVSEQCLANVVELEKLMAQWDGSIQNFGQNTETLKNINSLLSKERYFKSLLRDLDRKMERPE